MLRIIAKWFYKTTAVRLLIRDRTNRIKSYWTLPDPVMDNVVRLNNKAYTINPRDRVTDADGFPTYIYNSDSVNPINLAIVTDSKEFVENEYYYDPGDLHSATESKLATALTSEIKGGFGDVSSILMLVVILMLIGLSAFLFTQLQTMQNTINELEEVLRLVTGY